MNYIALNGCAELTHSFAKNGDGEIGCYHSDNTFCDAAEFNLADILADELPRLVRCPGCDKETLNEDDHIRACIGFKKPYSREEIMDAYSDPTEQTKRDILLSRQ